MVRFGIILVVGLLVWACGDTMSSSGVPSALAAFEKAQAETPSAENLSNLLTAYKEYIAANPTAHETNADLANKAASLEIANNQLPPAITTLTTALKNHFDAPKTADNALLLASAYETAEQTNVSNTIYQAYLAAFPQHDQVASIQSKLGQGLFPIDKRMDDMYQNVYNDSLQQLDYKVAQDFISSSEIHAIMLGDAERSAERLQQSAEIARALRNYPKALEMYAWVMEQYPDTKQAEQSFFLSAFTLDNDMRKPEQAKSKYEAFLAKYPASDFADDAKFLLDNLGKDEEEIIQMLQDNNTK